MTFDAIFYALLAGFIPSLVWLFFWLREDTHPEPRLLIAACFLAGMLSVAAAIVAEKYIADLFNNPTLRYSLWAVFEEIIKFLAVAVIALPSASYDEPIDAMIYCITAALGFAAIENTLFIMGPLSNGLSIQGLVTGDMRFIGATLVHVVSSALVGFALGYVFYHRSRLLKTLTALIGLGAAIVLHSAFNLSIINGNAGDILRSFAWVWGGVVMLIILFEEIKAVKEINYKFNTL